MDNGNSSKSDDTVVIAQIEAFKRRVPILYAVLVINTAALALTHYGLAPRYLTVDAPLAFSLIMAFRAMHWFNLGKRTIASDEARRMIRRTTVLAAVLAIAMLVWGCMLYSQSYDISDISSGITRRGQAVLYIGLTVIACISLLMHVRFSALLVTLLVIVPFFCFLFTHGTLVERAVAVNLGLVAAAMLYVVYVFSEDFESLVRSKAELRAISQHQEKLANTDSLTGLANRRKLFLTIDELKANGTSYSLVIIDLDGFKQVNDVYGHPVGDIVLQRVAERISASSLSAFCVSRMGGDEFAIIHPATDRRHVMEICKSIIEACSAPLDVSGLPILVGASIGVTVMHASADRFGHGNAIEYADYALTHAKRNGKGHAELFSPEHEKSIRRAGLVEQCLRAADLRTELRLLFQPIVDSRTRDVVGFEALARWNNPVLGEVSPLEFIAVAERSSVIHALTKTVIEKALAAAADWPSAMRLKLNLSARDISDRTQMLAILSILNASDFSASRITFELTETALEDLDVIHSSVAMMRAAGVSLAIDDFGTGYSSLSYVHKLRPTLIKIDRSFVNRLCDDSENSESIIRTIVELCNNIGARSLAEGVETSEQASRLTALHVDEMQGYFFGKPESPDLTNLRFTKAKTA